MISVGLGAAIRSVYAPFKMVYTQFWCPHTCIYISLCVVINDCSTRVSNELGAGNAKGARLALHVVVIVALSEGAFVGTITIIVRHVWGKLYSNEEEVINYVAKMLPLLALSNFFDGFQCVLSGKVLS